MKIAISGCGVAGPTLAYWLLQAGHEPTLIETAPALRDGGYMIDFWGVGFDVAERMGLLPAIRAAGYDLEQVRYVDQTGRVGGGISGGTMLRELRNRLTSIARGDLAAALYEHLGGRVETCFGASIVDVREQFDAVELTFRDGAPRSFDLVIGADGLHSSLRRLAFGPQTAYERSVGYYVAAFDAPAYRPRDELTYVSLALPGRQISRFAQRGDRTMFLLVFAAERLGAEEPRGLDERKKTLNEVFAGSGWEWPAIAAALERAEDVYFDRVSQIAMDRWSKGRVALVGDAAAAVSLLAGEGAGIGMAAAYVLAHEIAACDGDYPGAFLRYEARLRPFVEGKQRAARALASSFTPRTDFGIWLRNLVIRLMAMPGIPGLLLGAQLRDNLELPEFDDHLRAGPLAPPRGANYITS
jgi:2-polyprenyl-6-methoxyphenol hydroxylase-like FAD-dependent oxidoreductase